MGPLLIYYGTHPTKRYIYYNGVYLCVDTSVVNVNNYLKEYIDNSFRVYIIRVIQKSLYEIYKKSYMPLLKFPTKKDA